MTTYIVKTILCAASLYLIYYLLLEREKMYRFNRFFLLFCIAFSFMVSFIVIKVAAPVVPVNETVVIADNSLPAGAIQQGVSVPVETNNFLPNLLWALYIGISAYLLYRFIRNLIILFSKVKNNPTVTYAGAILVLTEDHAVPHSFLNYIFIDREKYEKGLIEKEILQHELTHVNPRHSLDIILVELLMVFGWVNPLMFFFRRSILLNHEFLADEAVVNTFNDTESYQLMLFDNACRSNNLILSSSFNYILTKKRLIMMTRTTSQSVAIVKQIALIPIIAAIGFLFSTRVIAQDKTQQLRPIQMEASKVDASQDIIDQYQAKLAKYKVETLEGRRNLHKNITVEEENKLGELFMKMSKEQQYKQLVHFMPKPKTAPSKRIPTQEQIELWKNPKVFGLWIDGKRVDNAVLNKYTNTDFDKADWSALEKNAKNYGKHYVQVDLMTKDYFEKFRAERKLDKEKYWMAIAYRKDELDKLKQEKESKNLLEQKVKLDKEQQSQLSKEQKDKFEKEKDAKLGSVQKEKLKMELDAKQTREQKIKSEKDSKQLYEQKLKLEQDSKQLTEQKLKLDKELQKQKRQLK